MSLPVSWYAAAADACAGDVVEVSGAEGHHAQAVRRMQAGEGVHLVDGQGTRLTGTVVAVAKGQVRVAVSQVTREPARSPQLLVAQAVPKSDRAEQAVAGLTEVGADLIVPWNAQRSQQPIRGERAVKQLDRWRSWALEAAKQSRRAWFPTVADPVRTDGLAGQVAAHCADGAPVLVLHESASQPLTGALDALAAPVRAVMLVVGPEGGISDEELAQLTQAGGQPVLLGDTVLRTSTAGVVAAAVVLSQLRDSWRLPTG